MRLWRELYSVSDYFLLLEIDKSFVIDLEILEKNYKKLILKYHPDNLDAFSNTSNDKNFYQKTSLINTAYEILKDPLLRACYLLQLKGINALDEDSTFSDVDFLSKQIKAREFLEDIEENISKKENVSDKLNEFLVSNKGEIDNLYEDLTEQFISEQKLDNIKNTIQKLKYYQQLIVKANKLKNKYS